MSRYNCLIKTYPDGTTLTKLYNYNIYFNEGQKTLKEGFCSEKQIDLENYLIQKDVPSKSNNDKKERDNKSRAVQKVYDYAKSNDFTWFCTFTVDPKICNSFDYVETIKELQKFRKYLTVHGLQYLIVPEQHESGAWHFHGLVSEGLKVVKAFKPDGTRIEGIYNIEDYKLGFTTATKIKSRERVNTYISKYITKEMSVPKGYKRYWASQGLNLPKEKIMEVKEGSVEYYDILQNNDYFKRVVNEYGTLYICEKQARS